MSRRGWLGAGGVAVIAISAVVWERFTPRAWQMGGSGFMLTASCIGFALGLGMLVFSLPRRVRTAAGLTVLVGVCLLLGAWPSWEGRVFPNVVNVDELVSATRAYRSPGSSLCVYTTDGPLWIAGRETPPDAVRIGGRVIGFYANPLPLRGRVALMSLGFRLRPVWPGAAHSVP